MLVDYALHGHWERGGHGGAFLALNPENQRLLDAFAADTDRRGFSIRTVRPCLIRLRQFLLYLQGRELLLKQVNSKIISDFVATQLQFRQRTVEMITYCLRMFFSFLHQHGELPTDLSGDVPRVRVVKDQRIPSVWKREDVERLLAAVDRGNPTGKRDYAILLLVLRLGLRVGDIRELRLEHFLLTRYLSEYLPGQRNVSTNTIKSYRDAFSLLLTYCRQERAMALERLTLQSLTATLIEEFLLWLERTRGNGATTRNQRLVALHAFYRYLQQEEPAWLLLTKGLPPLWGEQREQYGFATCDLATIFTGKRPSVTGFNEMKAGADFRSHPHQGVI